MVKFNFTGICILAILLIQQTIVKGECENVPEVPESSNNATEHGPLADGSSIEFTCNPGYKGVGSTYYYCRGSEWAGNFSCLQYCQQIKPPQNGLIVGNPEYVVNTRLEFSCLDGYTIDGPSSMLCRADGNWRPETPPTCDPVRCGDFGSVSNGEVSQINPDGVLNDIGSEIRITCNDSCILIGSPTVTCKSDGTWNTRPQCKISSCGTHPGLKSKCIDHIATSDDGSILSILCHDNAVDVSVTVVGTGTAFCENNQWDNLDMGCFCDCLVDIDSKEGIYYNNLFNKKFVKHGDQLNWDCEKGYRKQGSTNISCYDGLMEKPHCVRKKERNEQNKLGTESANIIVVTVGIVVLSSTCVVIYIVYFYNKKKGRKNEADEEKPVTERFGGTTTDPLIDRSSLDQCDTETPTTQSSSDQCDTETPATQSSHWWWQSLTTRFLGWWWQTFTTKTNQSSSDQCDTETPITQSSRDQCDTETTTTQSPHDLCDTGTPTTQSSRDQYGTGTPTTQSSRDQCDIETPTIQFLSDQCDTETPTTQLPHDQCVMETPTTQSSRDQSDTEAPTTQSSRDQCDMKRPTTQSSGDQCEDIMTGEESKYETVVYVIQKKGVKMSPTTVRNAVGVRKYKQAEPEKTNDDKRKSESMDTTEGGDETAQTADMEFETVKKVRPRPTSVVPDNQELIPKLFENTSKLKDGSYERIQVANDLAIEERK